MEAIETFRVREKADEMDEDLEDDVIADYDMLRSIGITATLVWQWIPYFVTVAKVGEALNESPLYISEEATHKDNCVTVDSNGKITTEPLLRDIKVFAPTYLMWIFPMEKKSCEEFIGWSLTSS